MKSVQERYCELSRDIMLDIARIVKKIGTPAVGPGQFAVDFYEAGVVPIVQTRDSPPRRLCVSIVSCGDGGLTFFLSENADDSADGEVEVCGGEDLPFGVDGLMIVWSSLACIAGEQKRTEDACSRSQE